ncbi:hypothetical protein [Specibacter cremeus]|uniref:hypothetical protein n=1 Tax=Specibacter cremeus TaxID=1629051 RepID=UPI000F79BC9A|nr:hypothetical protein [Specibacter cremeus]
MTERLGVQRGRRPGVEGRDPRQFGGRELEVEDVDVLPLPARVGRFRHDDDAQGVCKVRPVDFFTRKVLLLSWLEQCVNNTIFLVSGAPFAA